MPLMNPNVPFSAKPKAALKLLIAMMLVVALTPLSAFAEDQPSDQLEDTVQPGLVEAGGADGDAASAGTDALSSADAAALPEGTQALSADLSPKAQNGQGTEADPLVLSTAQEFLDFVTAYNAGTLDVSLPPKEELYVVLGGNIDLSSLPDHESWAPLGPSLDNPFVSNIDGKGHTISGLLINEAPPGINNTIPSGSGLIGAMSAGSIKNLTIDGTVGISLGNEGILAAGLLVGGLYPVVGKTVMLADCKTIGTMSISGGTYAFAGGSIGGVRTAHDQASVSITGCTSSVTVSARSNNQSVAGGLVGIANTMNAGGGITVSKCLADGAVSAKGAQSENIAGGLIGFADSSSPTGLLSIEDCTGMGTVLAEAEDPSLGTRNSAGGLVGQTMSYNGASLGISKSSAAGTASALGDSYLNAAGGLVGYAIAPRGATTVEDSLASASAISSGSRERNIAGGFIGYLRSQSDDSRMPGSVQLAQCSAKGDAAASGAGVCESGGLIGWAQTYKSSEASIKKCSASGTASTASTLGGFAGGLIGGITAEDDSAVSVGCSFATGNAKATGTGDLYNEAGGLIGYFEAIEGSNVSFDSVYATGNAFASEASENYAGGLIATGFAESGSTATVKNFYALGTAEVTNAAEYAAAGGVFGYIGVAEAEVAVSAGYGAGNASASGGTAVNSAGGLGGAVEVRYAGELTVADSVAANEAVQASGGQESLAARIIGTADNDEGRIAFALTNDFAWKGMKVNGATVADGGLNGTGVSGADLLSAAFWAGNPYGPEFDGVNSWSIEGGRLPLLYCALGTPYTPPYLIDNPPTPTPPAPDPNKLAKTDDALGSALPFTVLAALVAGAIVVRAARRNTEEALRG